MALGGNGTANITGNLIPLEMAVIFEPWASARTLWPDVPPGSRTLRSLLRLFRRQPGCHHELDARHGPGKRDGTYSMISRSSVPMRLSLVLRQAARHRPPRARITKWFIKQCFARATETAVGTAGKTGATVRRQSIASSRPGAAASTSMTASSLNRREVPPGAGLCSPVRRRVNSRPSHAAQTGGDARGPRCRQPRAHDAMTTVLTPTDIRKCAEAVERQRLREAMEALQKKQVQEEDLHHARVHEDVHPEWQERHTRAISARRLVAQRLVAPQSHAKLCRQSLA
jgi:hypothetical protein